MVAILGYSREQIVTAVRNMYTAVADAPSSSFHFPVGRPACRLLGYPREQIDDLPESLLESFAGVGCPFQADAIRKGDTVLDIGAGAGNDSLIARRLAGPDGHVIALDLTPAMMRKLKRAVDRSGTRNIHVIQGTAERLPLKNESVDSITSNGALNLMPDKRRAVAEMFRVLRPGGRLQIADVVIRRPVTVDCHGDPRLWVECVVGATVEEDFLTLFRDAGFEDIRVLRTLDYFAHSPSRQTREIAESFGARSIEIAMRRGARAPGRAVQWLQRLNPRRLLASVWRRGFMGMAGLVMAVLACYGTLAAVSLLALLGVGLALNEMVWVGAIALFTILTMAAVIPGVMRHRSYGPAVLAVAAAGVVLYALFIDYHALIELTGFILLAGAVGWDIHARRRGESRILGLETGKNRMNPRSSPPVAR